LFLFVRFQCYISASISTFQSIISKNGCIYLDIIPKISGLIIKFAVALWLIDIKLCLMKVMFKIELEFCAKIAYYKVCLIFFQLFIGKTDYIY